MKIPAIKLLVENYLPSDLKQAENDLIEGEGLKIDVEGEDEGEQLTHVIAALWIMEEMNAKNIEFKEALREYTKKVRESIN
ncbi:hypothetical protein MYP_776 [Sporocytophaga myxococcoides]|uniref:Uncharacterized protein n=1 Tax=Sporocytophaga myxococcoides TaxID=153721 RepID=A0A098LAS1_9BACT|nr:hypothetical protein [Sporocytophaga myxococcoides]GAL83549.1 hypothetical protein MYP_776 [Sporocytophaga myxococcoides]